MISVEVDKSSLNKLLRKFNKYPIEVQKGIRTNILKSVKTIETDAKRIIKAKKIWQTGRLFRSINSMLTGKASGKTFTPVEYAADVEKGHSARTVKVPAHTRIVKGLSGNKKIPVRAHTKRMPARAARPYLKPAAEKEFPKLVNRLKILLKKI